MEEWVQLELNTANDIRIEGIALIPAYYPEHAIDGHFGFPKRFRIDLYSYLEPDKPINVVDWTQKDFPDPGLYPVIFSVPNIAAHAVRLTVTKGALKHGSQFFALDEIMVFRNGNNVAPTAAHLPTASGQRNLTPYWHLNYLIDGKTHLGTFLNAKQGEPVADFIQYFEHSTQPSPEVKLTIDLGKTYSLGRMELYAAKDPTTAIPTLALPHRYHIELFESLQPPRVIRSEWIDATDTPHIRLHALASHDARYVRITFTRLPVRNGHSVLALGELRLIGDNVFELDANQSNLALDKKVSIHHKLKGSPVSPTLLVDGYANGKQIIPERTYIEHLSKKAIVEKAHRAIMGERMVAQAVNSQRRWTIGISLGTLALSALIFWLFHLRNEKYAAIRHVQQQIAADLHDDISGNLGTISMISNRLRSLTDDPLSQEKLFEISHLSKESYLSIKEIIWHTDSQASSLSDLFAQIKRAGRSILSECRVIHEFPDQLNDTQVSAITRRNIMLLIKESFYNCAKYAKAKNMLIRAQIDEASLVLTMRDDGCGFDSTCENISTSESGRGLKNMALRAKLLGADLSIDSSPGQGTEIQLTIPLDTQ